MPAVLVQVSPPVITILVVEVLWRDRLNSEAKDWVTMCKDEPESKNTSTSLSPIRRVWSKKTELRSGKGDAATGEETTELEPKSRTCLGKPRHESRTEGQGTLFELPILWWLVVLQYSSSVWVPVEHRFFRTGMKPLGGFS